MTKDKRIPYSYDNISNSANNRNDFTFIDPGLEYFPKCGYRSVPEVNMFFSMGSCQRVFIVACLVIALVITPAMTRLCMAAEGAVGVGVSGAGGKSAQPGMGAPVPPKQEPAAPVPPEQEPALQQPPPVQSSEVKEAPKGIGASAGTAGTAGTEAGKGISYGWYIAGGVLGLGLILGLAGGGGGESSSNH